MSKQDVIQLDGVVVETLPNTTFKVRLDNSDRIVMAHVSGKIRMNNIRIIQGDKVLIEMSTYDLMKARIVYRQK